ncbi:MAG: peptidoglycan editing factor PgeF [Clostridium sp.]|nr:peptidoglycan editing factor PgeF [Clostridium sp.]
MELIRTKNRAENGIGVHANHAQVGEADFPYLTFPNLEKLDFLAHLFTTRMGGVSSGALQSLNLSYARGDEPANVNENFLRVAKVMGVSVEDMVFTDQTHTANVRVVTEDDRGKGAVRPRDFQQIDGLITNTPGIVLCAFFADCVPILLADPAHRAIGLVHSGWRGTAASISQAALGRMRDVYGTRPEDCFAAVGPSICRDCYEVSAEVAEVFLEMFRIPAAVSKAEAEEKNAILYRKPDGKYQLDLWRANERLLLDAGVSKEHIFITDVCTCCNHKLLFSHRASNGQRGNLGAFMMIKKDAKL